MFIELLLIAIIFGVIMHLFNYNVWSLEKLTTFNGKMDPGIDEQYKFDKLFDDVTYYGNIYSVSTTKNGIIPPSIIGEDTCKKECKNGGTCVPYGYTGAAHCFH